MIWSLKMNIMYPVRHQQKSSSQCILLQNTLNHTLSATYQKYISGLSLLPIRCTQESVCGKIEGNPHCQAPEMRSKIRSAHTNEFLRESFVEIIFLTWSMLAGKIWWSLQWNQRPPCCLNESPKILFAGLGCLRTWYRTYSDQHQGSQCGLSQQRGHIWNFLEIYKIWSPISEFFIFLCTCYLVSSADDQSLTQPPRFWEKDMIMGKDYVEF